MPVGKEFPPRIFDYQTSKIIIHINKIQIHCDQMVELQQILKAHGLIMIAI
jgi:hypothetical protein